MQLAAIKRFVRWCNGNTAPFGGVIHGSNPCRTANNTNENAGSVDVCTEFAQQSARTADRRVRFPVTIRHRASSAKIYAPAGKFIEPNPGSRAVNNKYRYASCNLRFKVQTPTERLNTFIARVSDAVSEQDREDYTKPDDTTEGWLIGEELSCRGSLHCDTWEGTAAQLAQMEHIIVYPANGWWRLRPYLSQFNRRIRYICGQFSEDTIPLTIRPTNRAASAPVSNCGKMRQRTCRNLSQFVAFCHREFAAICRLQPKAFHAHKPYSLAEPRIFVHAPATHRPAC